MKPFDVYPLFDIEPVRAMGSYIWDKNNTRYLDLYGGHAVISIGHSHVDYVKKISEQLSQIGFYSNSVKMPMQQELASLLGRLSGYPDYDLFLSNSGAEANENALKLASFHTGRKKVIAFKHSFHGRTSLAVEATDDAKIQAPINQHQSVLFLLLNDIETFNKNMNDEVCAVIVEGIQGVGGVHIANADFLKAIREACDQTGAVMILDEVQSGYGRSGYFFAHQHSLVKPDLITIAKGMGNGFPVAGTLISSKFTASHGLLGTTFGGSYLACAAALAVLEIIESEDLISNASNLGSYLINELKMIPGIKEVRGMGLMIGIELYEPCAPLRKKLLEEAHVFTGASSQKNTLRILPALSINKDQADYFLKSLKQQLN